MLMVAGAASAVVAVVVIVVIVASGSSNGKNSSGNDAASGREGDPSATINYQLENRPLGTVASLLPGGINLSIGLRGRPAPANTPAPVPPPLDGLKDWTPADPSALGHAVTVGPYWIRPPKGAALIKAELDGMEWKGRTPGGRAYTLIVRAGLRTKGGSGAANDHNVFPNVDMGQHPTPHRPYLSAVGGTAGYGKVDGRPAVLARAINDQDTPPVHSLALAMLDERFYVYGVASWVEDHEEVRKTLENSLFSLRRATKQDIRQALWWANAPVGEPLLRWRVPLPDTTGTDDWSTPSENTGDLGDAIVVGDYTLRPPKGMKISSQDDDGATLVDKLGATSFVHMRVRIRGNRPTHTNPKGFPDEKNPPFGLPSARLEEVRRHGVINGLPCQRTKLDADVQDTPALEYVLFDGPRQIEIQFTLPRGERAYMPFCEASAGTLAYTSAPARDRIARQFAIRAEPAPAPPAFGVPMTTIVFSRYAMQIPDGLKNRTYRRHRFGVELEEAGREVIQLEVEVTLRPPDDQSRFPASRSLTRGVEPRCVRIGAIDFLHREETRGDMAGHVYVAYDADHQIEVKVGHRVPAEALDLAARDAILTLRYATEEEIRQRDERAIQGD